MQMTLAEIVGFVNGTRRDLLASAAGLSAAQADFRTGRDRWSIGQLLHHVALSEGRIGRRMAQLVEQAEQQNVPPPGEDRIDLSVFLEVRRRAEGVRFQSPPESAPPHGVPLPQVLAELERARGAILDLVPALRARDMSRFCFPHPVFGDFNAYQWLFFIGGHERRHREQVEAVKQAPGWPG